MAGFSGGRLVSINNWEIIYNIIENYIIFEKEIDGYAFKNGLKAKKKAHWSYFYRLSFYHEINFDI